MSSTAAINEETFFVATRCTPAALVAISNFVEGKYDNRGVRRMRGNLSGQFDAVHTRHYPIFYNHIRLNSRGGEGINVLCHHFYSGSYVPMVVASATYCRWSQTEEQ